MTRRVLYVEETYGFGGSTTSVLTLAEHLDPCRYRGTIVLGYPLRALKGKGQGLRFVSLPLRPPALPTPKKREGAIAARVRFLSRLIRDVLPRALSLTGLGKREKVSLVHVNNNLRLNLAGILAARLIRVPCVAHIRNFERINLVSRWSFHRVAHCLAMSDAVKTHMIQAGLDGSKILRVWTGLSAEELNRPVWGIEFRRSLGIPQDRLVYGLVGMLVHWKGHKLFLEAASLIQKEVPEALGLIIGDTPIPDDPYRRELETEARMLGLNGQVRFTGFWSDSLEAFAALDVVVHASTAPEPFGRVLVEAMGVGRPVVAADAGGPLEIIIPGETGLLFPTGDAKALADAVITLLRDSSLSKRLGEAARRRVTEVFRVEKEAAVVQALYDQVLGAAQ